MTEDEAIEAMARALWGADADDFNIWPALDENEKDEQCVRVYPAFAALRPYLNEQFAAGAEAMREACLREADPNNELGCGCEICCGRRAALMALESNIRTVPAPTRGDGGKV